MDTTDAALPYAKHDFVSYEDGQFKTQTYDDLPCYTSEGTPELEAGAQVTQHAASKISQPQPKKSWLELAIEGLLANDRPLV